MSLINKMLQDLESRKNVQADAASKKTVYEDLKPVEAPGFRAPSSRRLGMMVLALALVGGGVYAWMQWGELWLSGGPVAVKARPVVAPKAPPRPAPTPVAVTPAPAAKETPVVQAAATATEKPKEAPPANAQTTSAVEAPKAAPMTNTVHAPAPVETKTISASEPKAVPAAGSDYWTVAKGETLYSISAKTGIDLWDLSKWNHLGNQHVIHTGQRLRLTPPDSSGVKSASSSDGNSKKKESTKKAKVAIASATKPATKKVIPEAVTASSDSGQASADNGVMDKKLKPPSPEERAENEYRQAVNLLQKGRTAEAEKRLKTALNVSPEHAATRELLAGLALQNGRWHEAQQILEQGIEKVPAHYPFALLLARIQVEHGSDQKALAVMESSRRAGAGSADYMAFLGELYRRAGNHVEAIKAYTEAIKLNPQEGRSWVGMGISLESAQDWKAAGEAYQRAIETGLLDDGLLKYARQRLIVVKNK